MDRDAVLTLCRRFADARPDIWAASHSPEESQDNCALWNGQFVRWLQDLGVRATRVECKGGAGFPRHSWDHEPDWRVFWHMVAKVGDFYVDWSRRQLEVDAALPFLQTEAELDPEWRRFAIHPTPPPRAGA